MLHSLPATILAFGLFTHSIAAANFSTSEVENDLRKAPDPRVRVPAALELGGSRAERPSAHPATAAEPLIPGTRGAIAALGRRPAKRLAVQARALDAIQALEGRATAAPAPEASPSVLVQLGSLRNETPVKSPTIERTVMLESRRSLDELPGVDVLPMNEQAEVAAQKYGSSAVLVTPCIRRLTAVRAGDEIVYSARIEYLVHTLPDGTLFARLTGSASTTASDDEARDQVSAAELRREVAKATARSALKRAPEALASVVR